MKIDKRKNYLLVVDVETANTIDDALCYDIGVAVTDRKGDIYSKEQYVVYDIFCLEKELMDTAYYSEKIPLYEILLKEKKAKLVRLSTVQKEIKELLKQYQIKELYAYNARFDYNALNTTLRYITKSKERWFFPYGIKINCIWNMACETIFQQKNYIKFALNNGFISERGNIRTRAENAYAYISKNPLFIEEHIGLDDVEKEIEILAKCYAQHKPMEKRINRLCWRKPTKYAKEKGLL